MLKIDKNKINKESVKTFLKKLTAALIVVLTLVITYVPISPTWDDIYAAVGLRAKTVQNIELEDLTVTFIDVGQGDAIFIYTESTSILIDTGPSGNAKTIKSVLDSFETTRLDYLIITHQHDDHNGSLSDLKKLIEIDNEIIPNSTAKMAGMTLTFTTKKNEKNTNTDEEITLEFLAPIYVNTDLNNMSLVIKLTYKNTSFLLMGDAEEEEEATLLKTYDKATLKADVLKVGHHGSESSSSQTFIQAVAPSKAVISVGADNDYGHPHAKTLQTLAASACEVYRTDEDGTLVFTTDGDTIEVFSIK